MTTKAVTPEAKVLAATHGVERAAREVIRYPLDVKPHRQLAAALNRLDKVRREART